jgi:hypothetical protein
VPVRRRPVAAPIPGVEPGAEVAAAPAEAAAPEPVVAESELDELVDSVDVGDGEVTTVSASAPAAGRRRTGGPAGAGARRPRGA